ncbi:MAG: c-type cytochrome [Phycisphaerae bacterium]
MSRGRRIWIRRAATAVVACAVTLAWAAAVAAAPGELERTAAAGDVMRGWRVFHQKQCVECHAIWDEGGHIGPDLGRSRTGRLSSGTLAGVMWNHIPKMLSRMSATGHAPPTLTRDEMADLFALIFFARQLDEQGDPARGREILRRKGCAECHSVDTSDGGIGPDLAKWGGYANSVVWAQMMWEHAPLMEAAMTQSQITWPKLEGSDLVHIVAYVRSVGVSGEKIYLHPGSETNGRRLFAEKGCHQCHPGTGPDLSTVELPRSIGALASRMWNHSPDMAKVMQARDVKREPIAPQELADILAYVLALGNRDRAGDRARGERVFAQKGCSQCHDRREVAGAVGPIVAQLRRDAAPVDMATALWNHGETMLERMTEAGITWPVFDNQEMVDLLAFLRSVEPPSETPADRGAR